MLKKEFRDTLRILVESSVMLLAVPLIILMSIIMGFKVNYVQLIKIISIITVFAFSGYSGLGMFLWEKRDKGFEYLLTLPISRLKLFIYKLLPRFVVLMAMLGTWALVFNMPVKNYIVVLIFIQLAAACLSLAFNSYFAALIGIILLGFFYSLSRRFIIFLFYRWQGISNDPITIISPYVLAALLLGIPLAISFLLAFRNFDLKPYKYVIRPYLFIALPLLLVQVVVIFFYYEKIVYFY
ncbi:MAG: hypothetical protein PVH61_15800 [Candidatus Aminicenantes bacterium]